MAMIKDEWILLINNQMDGPFTTAQVAAKLAAGEVSFACVAWREGFASWKRLGELSEFDRRPARPVELKTQSPAAGSSEANSFLPSSDELLKSVFRREGISRPSLVKVDFVEEDRPADAIGDDLIGPLPWMKKLSIVFVLAAGLQIASSTTHAAPKDPSGEVPAAVVGPAKKFEVLGIAPSFSGKKATLRFQTSGFQEISVRRLIVRVVARPGDIVGRLRYDRTIKKVKNEGSMMIVELGRESLNEGRYRLKIEDSKNPVQAATGEFFWGERSAEFEKRLQAYLKSVSDQLQREKKALFYSAENLERLAREATVLSDPNSREPLRQQVINVDRGIAHLSKSFQPNRSAFLEEYEGLRALSRALLMSMSGQGQHVRANDANRRSPRARSIASADERDLVSEIRAFKIKIAELSLFNQSADTAADREAARSQPSEKI